MQLPSGLVHSGQYVRLHTQRNRWRRPEQLSMSDRSLETLCSPPYTHGWAHTAPVEPPDEAFDLVHYSLEPFILSPLSINTQTCKDTQAIPPFTPSAFFQSHYSKYSVNHSEQVGVALTPTLLVCNQSPFSLGPLWGPSFTKPSTFSSSGMIIVFSY